jgi:hypothetical protein
VEKIENYTQNGWGRLKNTLETSVFQLPEAYRLAIVQNLFSRFQVSDRSKFVIFQTRYSHAVNVFYPCRESQGDLGKSTLETSGEDVKLHSKRVEKMIKYTRNEWRRSKPTFAPHGYFGT